MKYENINLLRGFDLFFDHIAEKDLKAICEDIGGEVSYNVEQKSVTYMCENQFVLRNEQVYECHQHVNDLGKLYENALDCIFLHSELYLGRDRRSIHHWDLPDVEIVSVTYRG